MASSSSSSPPLSVGGEQPVTTETFQKQYGRGSVGGYSNQSTRGGHGYPPSEQQHYPPTQYAPSPQGHQYVAPPPPPPLPKYNNPGPLPQPPGHGYHQSYYYPPHGGAPFPPPVDGPSSSQRSNPSRAPPNPNHIHPSLITPKSNDSDNTLTPYNNTSSNGFQPNKTKQSTSATSTKRTAAAAASKRNDGATNKLSSNNSNHHVSDMGEEPKVDPMRQDFHFYAMDQYELVKQVCQRQLDDAFADGTISKDTSAENQLYLLTTLINARLIKNWEDAPPSTRDEYLKKEEADRKRFMSEEQVASRYCATLTARRRSPKQSSDLERSSSFGLSAVEGLAAFGVNRDIGLDAGTGLSKRSKAMV